MDADNDQGLKIFSCKRISSLSPPTKLPTQKPFGISSSIWDYLSNSSSNPNMVFVCFNWDKASQALLNFVDLNLLRRARENST